MGRRKRRRRKPRPHTLILEIGKFYNVHDGSPRGHPGRIEFADYTNDIYISITTGSLTEDKYKENKIRSDYYFLKCKTTNDVFKSLIHKRPFIGTRDDYGDMEYKNMIIDKEDYPKIKIVLSKKPREGYWFKKRKKPSS